MSWIGIKTKHKIRQSRTLLTRMALSGKPALNIKPAAYLKMTPDRLADRAILQLKEYIRDGRAARVDEAMQILEILRTKLKAQTKGQEHV